MATRIATITNPESIVFGQNYRRVTWAGLLNGDDATPFPNVSYADRNFSVRGTFGAGGTVLLEGSNDGGTTYNTLKDQSGTAISLTAQGEVQVRDLSGLVRPRVTAGDGTTSLQCDLVARSNLR